MAKKPAPLNQEELERLSVLRRPTKTEQDITDKIPEFKTFMGREAFRNQKFDDKTASRYLRNYALTGRKVASAISVGVNISTIMRWEKDDELFAELTEEARQIFVARLERELFRRGVEGYQKPIVGGKFRDEVVAYEEVFSDKCLEMMLRRHAPEHYKTQMDVNANVTTGVVVVPATVSAEESGLPIEDAE